MRKLWKTLLILCMVLLTCTLLAVTVSATDFEGWTVITGDTFEIEESGNYYLDSDTAATVTVKKGVTATIDLNGHVLCLPSGTTGKSVIYNEGTLTVQDSDPSTQHHFGESTTDTGLWVWDSNEADTTHVVNGGCITGGCGIADNSKNNPKYYGGGINNKGTLTVTGGNIVGNKTDFGGGIYNDDGATALLANCNITGNKATVGGGVYVSNTTFEPETCLIKGTDITMADGSTKKIENVAVGDLVKSFNHETGLYESSKVIIAYHGEKAASYFTLHFAGGTELSIAGAHNLYEQSSHSCVTISLENYASYIGKYFYCAASDSWEELVSVSTSSNSADYYSLYVAKTVNCIANGMLTAPDDVAIVDFYTYNDDLTVNADALQDLIDTYGLTSFEDFPFSTTYENYEAINGRYYNIVLGLGYATAEELAEIFTEWYDISPKPMLMKAGLLGATTETAALTFGGTTVIDGNIGDNLYLASGRFVTVCFDDNNCPKTGMHIGITTEIAPTTQSIPVSVEHNADYSSYFFSDNDTYFICDEGSSSSHRVILRGPIFDDRFGDEVNLENYTEFTSTHATSKGYTFDGWYTGVDGTGTKLGNSDTPIGKNTYYAHWKKGEKTVITAPLDFKSAESENDIEYYATARNGVTFVPASGGNSAKLILNNALLDIGMSSENGYCFGIRFAENIVIETVGTSYVNFRQNDTDSYMIGFYQDYTYGSVTFTGGKLIVSSSDFIGNSDVHAGYQYLVSSNRDLTFKNIDAEFSTGTMSYGEESNYSYTDNYCLKCGSLIVEDAKLKVTAGTATGAKTCRSYGISYSSGIHIDSSEVTFSGETGAIYNFDNYVQTAGVDGYGSADYLCANPTGIIKYVYVAEDRNCQYRVNGEVIKTFATALHYEASIGTEKYTTVQKAINAAQTGDTVVLLLDVIVSDPVIVSSETELTFDLNGHVLALDEEAKIPSGIFGASGPDGVIVNEGKLTVKDGSDGKSVHYLAVDTENRVMLIDSTDENLDADKLIYDYYDGRSDKAIPIEVTKILGGVIGPCESAGIANEGLLILESGSITLCEFGVKNGVYYYYETTTEDSVTFIMNGGAITGFKEPNLYNLPLTGHYSYNPCGVYNSGIFIMNAGEITNNYTAGVVNENTAERAPVFKMFGGKIEGNESGGVLVMEETEIYLGGTVSVKSNTQNGKNCNLSLAENTVVLFDEEHPLSLSSCVGVTTAKLPTTAAYVPVTEANDTDYHTVFAADNGLTLVATKDDKTVLILFEITQQPAASNDFEVKVNADDVTYEWRKILPDLILDEEVVSTESIYEWEGIEDIYFSLPNYYGTVEDGTFTSCASTYINYFTFATNGNLLKVGDSFIFTASTPLKLDYYSEDMATLEDLGNCKYRITILRENAVVELREVDQTNIPFTITDVRIKQDVAVSGKTSAKFGTATEAGSYFCRVYRLGDYLDSDTVTAVEVSFADVSGATGSAPADYLALTGKKITLPANPFSADGAVFNGWFDGKTTYAASTELIVGSQNMQFTARLEHTCHHLTFDKILTDSSFTYNSEKKLYTLAAGNYYLAKDFTLPGLTTLAGNCAICLNGHVLDLNGTIISATDKSLFLCDCKVDDAHTHYYKINDTTHLWELSDATDYDKAVKGGVITNGIGASESVIHVAKLTAEDVNFIGNNGNDETSTEVCGGAVSAQYLSIRRCRFYGNAAYQGGAINSYGTLNAYDSDIQYNYAVEGGGAINAQGKVLLDGCTVKNNSTANKGGAFLFDTYYMPIVITVIDTVVSDNEAGEKGGAMAFDEVGCFIAGTKITMADGTEEDIENIKVGDSVKTFNHETGMLENGTVHYTFESGQVCDYFTLHFESGKTLSIVDCHDLFDQDANRYVTVYRSNRDEFIGHRFYNAADGTWETLESTSVSDEGAKYYSIYVSSTLNCLANGMLTLPDDVDFVLNVYEFDPDTLQADAAQLAADIAAYGLITLADCELCESQQEFDNLNLKYKNLFLGKNLISAFDLNELFYEAHDADEFSSGIVGPAVILGKNAVIKNNTANGETSNVYLDFGAMIYVIEGATGIDCGVSLADTVGNFAADVYTNDAEKVKFTSDLPGLTQFKTAEGTPATYDYSLAYIKKQPCKDNDYTVETDSALTGVTYQWYKYVDGENDVALTGETNAKLGTSALENTDYYCTLIKGGEVIATSESITPVAVSFAGGEDATGTAPATLYQLDGRKITLPANTFTKIGYKFDKWGSYAAGSEYTVGSEAVTLTASWTEKATLTVAETAQESQIGETVTPFTVSCTEISTDFTVSYRKSITDEWSTVVPSAIGVYQVRIEREEDDTYKAVDITLEDGFSVYYLLTFGNNGATSGQAPSAIKETTALADFNPATSGLVGAFTMKKEGFVLDGWLVEKENALVKWEAKNVSDNCLFYPCWKPVVNTLSKSNDFTVTLKGTDISYQWYTFTGTLLSSVSTDYYLPLYGTYNAQTNQLSSQSDELYLASLMLDTDFASEISYLKCKISGQTGAAYYDYNQVLLLPDAEGYYNIPVFREDESLIVCFLCETSFTATDISIHNPSALITSETGTTVKVTPGTEFSCKVSYINRVDEMTFVSSALSNVVTPVKVSFAGGEGATGTAPATLYQLDGRKVTLPANTFAKANFKFTGWGNYAVGADYTVGSENTELTAEWEAKSALFVSEEAQQFTYKDTGISFAVKNTTVTGFTVEYYVSDAWTTQAPTAAGSYKVRVSRAEDDTYASYSKEISDALIINKLTLNAPTVKGSYAYTGKPQTVLFDNDDYMESAGDLQATGVGTYQVTFTLTDSNTQWATGETGIVNWTISPSVVTVDWAADNYIYNGNVQIITASYKDVNNATVALNVTVENFKNAGEYTATVSFAAGETDYVLPETVTKSYTMAKLAVNEPSVSGSYKYNGNPQTVTVNGVESFMSTADSTEKTEPGVYTLTYTLDENHCWADGSDGVLTWEIKAVQISPEEKDAPTDKKKDVIVETDEGFPSDITVVVEVTVESALAESIDKNRMAIDYYDMQDSEIKLERNEKIGVVFNVKLIRTVNGVESEIQPEDIAPGTKIRVKMLIPEDVDLSKVTRILHVHNSEKIEEIAFDASKVDADRYFEIEISELSEFAFVYEHDFTHWIALALLIALLGFVALLAFGFKIKHFKQYGKVMAAPAVGLALHFAGTAALFFFAYCKLCYALLGANLLALLLFVLLFAAKIGKVKGQNTPSPKQGKQAKKAETVTEKEADAQPQKTEVKKIPAQNEAKPIAPQRSFRFASIDVNGARKLYSDTEIERLLKAGKIRFGELGKEAIINVDTLCEHFADGEEIDLAKLKAEKLVPASAKRLKVLARGELSKKFTVVADAFSYDAVKMIFALGGSVIRLWKKKK